MHGWETRMLLKHCLDQGVSKSELSRRFGIRHLPLDPCMLAACAKTDLHGRPIGRESSHGACLDSLRHAQDCGLKVPPRTNDATPSCSRNQPENESAASNRAAHVQRRAARRDFSGRNQAAKRPLHQGCQHRADSTCCSLGHALAARHWLRRTEREGSAEASKPRSWRRSEGHLLGSIEVVPCLPYSGREQECAG